MVKLAGRSPRLALILNLALSVAVSLAFLGLLEGVSRGVERRRPRPVVADYIWNWQQKWDGDFYTIRADTNGWPPWEEFNADGLRDRMHAPEKPEGVTRVFFLGDSVTLGAEIEPAQAFPQLLQEHFDAEGRPIEVFNVALWGWSTRQERIAFERLAEKYRPAFVVLGVCLNDIPELQNNLARPPGWLSWLFRRSALVRLLVNAPGREIQSVEQLFDQPRSRKVEEGYARFFEELRALRREVEQREGRLAVLVFPFRFQVLPDAPAPHAQQRIGAFCEAEGLRCLDLLPALAPAGGGAFVDYDHLSPAGSRRVADAILAAGLLPSVESAQERLEGLGRAASATDLAQLLALARADDAGTRAAAAWLLGRGQPPSEAALDTLAKLLDDPSERVRTEAAESLARLGPAARRAQPALWGRLADSRQGVRWAAARALTALELRAPGDVPALAEALHSDDAYVRGFAAFNLGNMGAAARAAVPDLVAALDASDGYDRGGAATALARLGPAAEAAVPALVRGLTSDDGDRRWKAARTLGRIGPAARSAAPALVRALGDENEYVRAQAARALGRVRAQGPEVEAALRRAGADSVSAVRDEAQTALRALDAR